MRRLVWRVAKETHDLIHLLRSAGHLWIGPPDPTGLEHVGVDDPKRIRFDLDVLLAVVPDTAVPLHLQQRVAAVFGSRGGRTALGSTSVGIVVGHGVTSKISLPRARGGCFICA